MELLSAAYFLIPGVFAVTTHRFASAQPLAAGSQLAWTVLYSAGTYLALQSPAGAWLRTAEFPAALFRTDARLLDNPELSLRLVAVSIVAAIVGLVVGRAASSKRSNRIVAAITGRNLHSTVWIEAFRNAPRQWVRLRNKDFDFIGWLESASDGPTERSLILSSVFSHDASGQREAVPGILMLVDAADFDSIVLLGADVAAAYDAAVRRNAEAIGQVPSTQGVTGAGPNF